VTCWPGQDPAGRVDAVRVASRPAGIDFPIGHARYSRVVVFMRPGSPGDAGFRPGPRAAGESTHPCGAWRRPLLVPPAPASCLDLPGPHPWTRVSCIPAAVLRHSRFRLEIRIRGARGSPTLFLPGILAGCCV